MKPFRAYARNVRQGGRSKLQARYAEQLEISKRAGLIHDYREEPFSLRLADRTHYRPDFLVIGQDGQVVIEEVKGFWEDDARVKIKVAAAQYPWFVFRAIQWKQKQWAVETI